MERIPILGVPIDAVSAQDVILRIAQFCRSAGQFHVATPNPEMLVEAAKNEEFRNVLRSTALNVPDGVGLVWAMKREVKRGHKRAQEGTRGSLSSSSPLVTSHPLSSPPVRVTGTDLLQSITSPASRLCPPERIFLLGAALGVAEKAAQELKKRNPAIKDIGTWNGSPRINDEAEIIRRINAFGPSLLFVAFGAPAQDLWIARNLKKMPCVKVAMGVGGAFDFIAGKKRRAPRWMQKIGIEWLWRLILEPRRIKRIWRAVVVFPWLVMTHCRV